MPPDVSFIFDISLKLLFRVQINQFLIVALVVNISFRGPDIVDDIHLLKI
jgi:hypothetical protein